MLSIGTPLSTTRSRRRSACSTDTEIRLAPRERRETPSIATVTTCELAFRVRLTPDTIAVLSPLASMPS